MEAYHQEVLGAENFPYSLPRTQHNRDPRRRQRLHAESSTHESTASANDTTCASSYAKQSRACRSSPPPERLVRARYPPRRVEGVHGEETRIYQNPPQRRSLAFNSLTSVFLIAQRKLLLQPGPCQAKVRKYMCRPPRQPSCVTQLPRKVDLPH